MQTHGRPYIVFVDETGFMMGPTVRRSWAPRGKTPILKITDPHGKISAIGAMALQREPDQFSFYFHLLADNTNFKGPSVAEFVKSLHRRLDGPFTLVWDDYCIHRARPVRDLIEATPTIQVVEFPPYAPELNPVDHVWSYVKYGRMANYCPGHLAELRQRVTEELTLVSQQPLLLKALFCRANLPLD
jgi:transposase